MTLPPWEYLFLSFNSRNFPDLFYPTWIAAAVLLVVLGVLYNVRTRALHRHPAYADLWEWLWWTGLITFSLLIIESLFVFDFFIVLLTEFVGIGTLIWIRFVRFPPILDVYEQKLAKQRYLTRQKFAHPESTIRPKAARASASRAKASRSRKRR